MTEISQTEMRIALLNMREGFALHVEAVQMDAKLKRAKFLALVNEGFTDQQAIELTK